MWRLRCGGLLFFAVLSCACLGSFAAGPQSQEKGSRSTAVDSAIHRRLLVNSSQSPEAVPESSQRIGGVGSAKNVSRSCCPFDSSAELSTQQNQRLPTAAGQQSPNIPPSSSAAPASVSNPAVVPVIQQKAPNVTQQPGTASDSRAAEQTAVKHKPGPDSPNGPQQPAAHQQPVVADSKRAHQQTAGPQPAAKSEGVDRQPTSAAPAAAEKPVVLGPSDHNQSGAKAPVAAEDEHKVAEQKPVAEQQHVQQASSVQHTAAAEQVPAAVNKQSAGWIKPYEGHTATGSKSEADDRTVIDSKPAVDSKPTAESTYRIGNKPAADSNPAVDSKQAPEKEPVADRKSTADSKPSSDNKPAADSKPPADNKPSSANKPPADNKPTADSKPAPVGTPAAVEKPATGARPLEESKLAPGNQPVMNSKPAAEAKPAADNKPAHENKPVADAKPTAESKPGVDSKPAANSNLAADNKTAANSQPAADSKPAAETNPAAENKPDQHPAGHAATEHMMLQNIPEKHAPAVNGKSAPTSTQQHPAGPTADPKSSTAEPKQSHGFTADSKQLSQTAGDSQQQPQITGESKQLPPNAGESKQPPQTPQQQPAPATAPDTQVLPAIQPSQHLNVRVTIPSHTRMTDATQSGADSNGSAQAGSSQATDANASDAAAAEDMEAGRAMAEQAAAPAAEALESQVALDAASLEVRWMSGQPSEDAASARQEQQTESSSAGTEETAKTAAGATNAAGTAEITEAAEAAEDIKGLPTKETLAFEVSLAAETTADATADEYADKAGTADADKAWAETVRQAEGGAELAADSRPEPSDTDPAQESPVDALEFTDTAPATAAEADLSFLQQAVGADVAEAGEDDFVSLFDVELQPADDTDADQQAFQQEMAGKAVRAASFRFVDPHLSNLYNAPEERTAELENWEHDEEEEDAVQEWFKKVGIKPRGSRRRYYNPVPSRPYRKYRYTRTDAAPSKVQSAQGSTQGARATGSAQALAYASQGGGLSRWESQRGTQNTVLSNRKAGWDRPAAGLSPRDAIKPFPASSNRANRPDAPGQGFEARLQQQGGGSHGGVGPQMPDMPDLKRINQAAKGAVDKLGSEKWRLLSIEKEEDIRWLTTAVREHNRASKKPVFLLAWVPGAGGNP